MAKDLVYIFNKLDKTSSVLGEIQTNFNMSLVIDGTRDSSKLTVHSFNGDEIEPNTILLHSKTNSWWIVAEDKVERRTNEQGFYYIHNLQIEGAIELFNARDLTDCGFNDNTYTVRQFLTRLLSLSNLEINCANFNAPSNFLDKNVDFIKTFENYTLLSALREFLDAYNMCPKLTFDTYTSGNVTYLDEGHIKIVPKTGDFSLPQHTIEDFDLIQETKAINKESFGTSVISNAENVISSKAKTFPSTGAVRTSATEFNIKPGNAVLRLPSKVYKGNWIKCIFRYAMVEVDGDIMSLVDLDMLPGTLKIDASSDASINAALDKIAEKVRTSAGDTWYSSFYLPFLEAFNNARYNLIQCFRDSGTMTLYDGNSVNPISKDIVQGQNVPYLALVKFHAKAPLVGTIPTKHYIFCDKEAKETLPNKYQGIAWERGSNLITGFDGFEKIRDGADETIGVNRENLDIILRYPDIHTNAVFFSFSNGYGNITISFSNHADYDECEFKHTKWIVNYIPMSDLKIKVDNQRDKKDIQLYNQNGRLTDSVALSKLINSYSKEISSDKITRYMAYTSFSDVPKVGSIVTIGNDYYVINNISMDFYQNESIVNDEFGYYIDCEITMCKYVSTKSLMVNPNTNIRDYGIPQNFNVKRKQLYRDYYEITYQLYSDANQETPYLDPSKLFIYPNRSIETDNYIGVIKLTYENEVSGETTWYYQLETTNYYLDKMLYVVLDFNDNNIIGYGSQNVFSGFDISRIFDGLTDTLNTPIQYTDENGKVLGIDILLCSNEELTTIYDEYQSEQTGGSSYNQSLYSYSVFIPEDIYTKALDDYSIRINEENYKKDAIEVPVFEYACQIEDSENVLLGDAILTQRPNMFYFYSFVVGDNLNQNNVDDTNTFLQTTNPLGFLQSHGASIEYEELSANTRILKIKLYSYQRYNIDIGDFQNGPATDILQYINKDIAIYRRTFDPRTAQTIADELLFIARKIPTSSVSLDGETLTLILNHYKLK